MKYQEKSFTVAASGGTRAECERVGHSWADRKGKCVRCGEVIREQPFQSTKAEPMSGH